MMLKSSLVVWLPILAILGVEAHWNVPAGYYQTALFDHRRPRPQQPQQPQPPGFNVVEGTLAQLNELDTQWVCTNQKTGDMIVIGTETGNTNAGGNRGGNPFLQNANRPQQPQQPAYPQGPQYPQYQQRPQQQGPPFNPQQIPQNPQQQGPPFNPQQVPQNPQQQIPQNPQAQQPQRPQNPQQQIPQNPQQQIPQNPQQVPQFNPQQSGPQQPQRQPGFPDLPWNAEPGKNEGPAPPARTTSPDPFKQFDNFDWTAYVTTEAPATTLDAAAYDGRGVIDPRLGTRD